jgi:hypothetical protein
MNLYFLMLYIGTALYRWLDFSNVLHLVMAFIKNVKLLGSLLVPDPKGTIEHQRGGILKVNYVDPNTTADQKKTSASHFLLPYAIPALGWTKVHAITVEEFNRTRREQAATGQIVNTDPDQPRAPAKHLKPIDEDLLGDMLAVSQTSKVDREIPVRGPKKVSLKGFEKLDVTEFIESLAGPGKDFFGCPIMPVQLNPDFKYLIFHFGRKSKTFSSMDSLASLG